MSIKEAPVIEVLKFDEEEAYNHDRPISSLIRTQLLHLHHAENIVIPAKDRTNININHLLTELEASDYIQKVTALLHRYGKKTAVSRSKRTRKPKKKNASKSAQKASTTSRRKKPKRRRK